MNFESDKYNDDFLFPYLDENGDKCEARYGLPKFASFKEKANFMEKECSFLEKENFDLRQELLLAIKESKDLRKQITRLMDTPLDTGDILVL